MPEVVAAACDQAGVRPRDLKLLVTNQPNAVFLRKLARGARALPAAHHDTFDAPMALGGFAHAGDYAAAAVMRWGGGA